MILGFEDSTLMNAAQRKKNASYAKVYSNSLFLQVYQNILTTAMTTNIASPADNVFELTDEGIARYVEFPSDTVFLESVASYEGKLYAPAQRLIGPDKSPQTFIYEVAPGMERAKEVMGPLEVEGSTRITVFGSSISSTGRMILCCFNRNSLLIYDMNELPALGSPAPCIDEIPDLPSPNDMCIDPNHENIVYVVGGTFRNIICGTFTNSAYGQVFKVNLSNRHVTTVAKDLDTLAGVEVVGKKIWVAQLYNVLTLNIDKNYEQEIVWRGNDGNGQVWLADNIDIMKAEDGDGKEDMIICPAYSMSPESTVDSVLSKNARMSLVLFAFQVMTMCGRGESFREAIVDPEVNLTLSNTYIKEGDIPQPIRFFLAMGTEYTHFAVDLKETRTNHAPWEPEPGKKRHYFNEQVTHMSHMKDGDQGYLVCVNFEQPRILFLKDDKFKKYLHKK
jgi:hypothetical protein